MMAKVAPPSKLPPFSLLDEPLLSFSPSDPEQVDVHPLRGLVNLGPFSKGSFGGYTSHVRIATIGPESAFKARGDLMRSLQQVHRATDRS
ncbi:MAG: nuclease PIN, partial [Alphaproteobacteria bacterium]